MMQDLLQSNLELQAEKLKNEFKEKERELTAHINNLTRESALNEKEIEDLTSKLKQAERNTKIECEKIEVTYRR